MNPPQDFLIIDKGSGTVKKVQVTGLAIELKYKDETSGTSNFDLQVGL